MTIYKAPVEDVLFLLNDVFHIERFANLPGFADASPDVVQAILATAGKFCEEVLAPLNRRRRRRGLPPRRRRQRHDAQRASRKPIGSFVDGRLDRHFGAARNLAASACRRH